MRVPLSIAAALLAAGAMSGVAIAQTSPSQAPSAPIQSGQRLTRLDRIAILLDLTDTQKLQVQQVLQTQREQMRALWQQQSSSGQKPDFRQLREARRQLRQQTLAQLQSLLSADQYRKLQVLMTMGGRGHWRHGPRPGAAAPSGGAESSGGAGSSGDSGSSNSGN